MLAARGVSRLHQRYKSRLAEPEIAPVPADPTSGRPSISARCAALGVRLTGKRQATVTILDALEGPFALEDAYSHCRDQGLDINRSSVYRLITTLMETGVLVHVGRDDRRDLYGAPLPVEVMLRSAEGAQARIDDPVLAEMIVAAAARAGVNIAGGQIVVSVNGADATHA